MSNQQEKLPPPALDDAQAVVVFSEHKTKDGQTLAQAMLNAPGTLNSLSLEMIDLLRPALSHWSERSDVVAVLFTGSGDKAFSAGGDITALRASIVANQAAGKVVDSYPFDFFEREYRLDYQLHNYPKPLVALGHGIVMGGGLGVFGGCAHRIVTEKSRIALPEVGIGLFPDAGATWLLGQMASHYATFLAVTGSHVNAADALAVGFANHSIPVAERANLLPALLALGWAGDAEADHQAITALLNQLPAAPLPDRQVDDIPETLNPTGTTAEVVARIAALEGGGKWIDRGVASMQGGCPASVGVAVEQLKRAPTLSMEACFQLEMTVATHCAQFFDFAEGVRALLIDKDGAPQWQHDSVAELPQAHVDQHFVEPWPQNPLHDLGA